eukprot:TRINITY_DN27736_c0_g1_i1.p1 TRINITY_DN27736_c0_g1~~TRINITY_DN27736_c0_g1_i1.p1  ORF type:complete len:593 (-),score=95.19 TRINITY_DN27736_c0_g1_i1:124-1902(-)
MATETLENNQSPVPSQNNNTSGSFPTISLYVGDLSPEVNEHTLFEIFKELNLEISSIKVCRDAITRRSLGYAYVNFMSPQDANTALQELNNTVIKGRTCRIMFSQRDPSLRKSGKGNIFIKNLAKEIDTKSLYDTFSQFGQILSCKVETEETGESKGYGYIQFASPEAAQAAIEKVNGKILADQQVFVGPFVSRKERIASNSEKTFTNVYVKNIDKSVTKDDLTTLFSKYGEVQSVVIMTDDKGESKGFGFANFSDAENARKACEELNETEFKGKQIYVGRAQKKNERQQELKMKFEQMKQEQANKFQGVNLYVKNLEDNIDDEKLRSLFEPYGSITSAKVMTDEKGKPKGFGFVCFSSPEEATKAVEMNSKMVGSKPLYVALHQRKDIRKQNLQAQFAQRGRGIGFIPQGRGGMPYPMSGDPNLFYQPNMMYPNVSSKRAPPFIGYPQNPNFNQYMVMQGNRGLKPVRGTANARGFPKGGIQNYPYPQMVMPADQMQGGQQSPQQNPNAQQQNAQPQQQQSTFSEQSQRFGEQLYPLILKLRPEDRLAGKITGMILEGSKIEELKNLVQDPNALRLKVDEAIEVLREHNQL